MLRTMWERLAVWPIRPPNPRHLPWLLPAHDWTDVIVPSFELTQMQSAGYCVEHWAFASHATVQHLHDFGRSQVSGQFAEVEVIDRLVIRVFLLG